MANKALGKLPHCGAHKPIPVANTIETSDASSTPQTSPLAYTTVEIDIDIPARAAEVILKPSTDLRFSEDSGMAAYSTIDGGSEKVIPCGSMTNLYIKGDTASGTLNFYFHIL